MKPTLIWQPKNLSALLGNWGIGNREQLSKVLPGVSRATVYKSFDPGWAGVATTTVLASMAAKFDISVSELVTVESGAQC